MVIAFIFVRTVTTMSDEVTLGESSHRGQEVQKELNSASVSSVPLNSSGCNVNKAVHKRGTARLQNIRSSAIDRGTTGEDESDASERNDDTPARPSPGGSPNLGRRLSESTGEIAIKLQRNTSQLFAIGSFAPVRRSVGLLPAHPGSDPVLDTINQLNAEDRTDRDLCCGMFASFRSALKGLWMLFSVAVVYSGFMGPYECQKITAVPVYVTVFGFILMLYMVLGEIAGAVAIWKGRRIGLCILALSQVILALWILFGYFAIPIVRVDYNSENVTSVVSNNGITHVTSNSQNYSGNCWVPHLCDCFYFSYMTALWGFAHVVLVLVLVYTLVVCVCVTKAAHEVRKHDRQAGRNGTDLPKDNKERGNSIVSRNGLPAVDLTLSPPQQWSEQNSTSTEQTINGIVPTEDRSIQESAIFESQA